MIDGVMNSKEVDYLLINLMEECAEIIQAASKCLRFGVHHDEPGYGHNGHRIAVEFGQMLAVYDLLATHAHPHLPIGPQGNGYRSKQTRMRLWLDATAKANIDGK